MVNIPRPKDGPSAEDWFAANNHDQLEHLTDEMAQQPIDVGTMAVKGAEQVVDEAQQARWNNFAAGRPLDHPAGDIPEQKQ